MATLQTPTDTGLLRQFRDFYSEIVRQKKRIAKDPDIAPDEIFHHLKDFLETIGTAGDRAHDHAIEVRIRREARYAMAALADEIFVHLEWPGAVLWVDRLLENEIFSSCISGELLFEKIREHLHVATKDRPRIYHDLTIIYLYTLALGFQGRYRNRQRPRHMHPELRRQRHALLAALNEHETGQHAHALFPGAQTTTPGRRLRERLPDVRRWRRIFLAVVVTYLLGSTMMWFLLTHELSGVAGKILVEQQEGEP